VELEEKLLEKRIEALGMRTIYEVRALMYADILTYADVC
jgi:hypothetical protein